MGTQPHPGAIGTSATPSGALTGGKPLESSLIQSSPQLAENSGAEKPDSVVLKVPVEVDVAVPIRKFRVRNLLALARGHVIETQWLDGDDMPLGARGAQLAWTEFEVIDQKLAVRITRLA